MLGWTVPEIAFDDEPIEITGVLGIGGSSTVYRGVFNSQSVVVKHFSTSDRAMQECLCLRQLQKALAASKGPRPFEVPKLVVDTPSDDGLAVVMTPIGIPFAVTAEQQKRVQSAPSAAKAMDSDDDDEPHFVLARAEHLLAVVDVLEFVHTLPIPIIHRDISPTNFFALPRSADAKGSPVSQSVSQSVCRSLIHGPSHVIR